MSRPHGDTVFVIRKNADTRTLRPRFCGPSQSYKHRVHWLGYFIGVYYPGRGMNA